MREIPDLGIGGVLSDFADTRLPRGFYLGS
jgi:hypothetical protein